MDREKQNEATRAATLYMKRGYVGDREGAGSFLAAEIVARDHRPLGGEAAVGRDAFLEAGMAHQDVGFAKWSGTPLEIRGESLALVRLEQATESDFTLPYLVVLRSDGAGRLAEIAIYDEDDLARAVEDLDRLYIAHEASPSAD